jgi:hypothetical protein
VKTRRRAAEEGAGPLSVMPALVQPGDDGAPFDELLIGLVRDGHVIPAG